MFNITKTLIPNSQTIIDQATAILEIFPDNYKNLHLYQDFLINGFLTNLFEYIPALQKNINDEFILYSENFTKSLPKNTNFNNIEHMRFYDHNIYNYKKNIYIMSNSPHLFPAKEHMQFILNDPNRYTFYITLLQKIHYYIAELDKFIDIGITTPLGSIIPKVELVQGLNNINIDSIKSKLIFIDNYNNRYNIKEKNISNIGLEYIDLLRCTVLDFLYHNRDPVLMNENIVKLLNNIRDIINEFINDTISNPKLISNIKDTLIILNYLEKVEIISKNINYLYFNENSTLKLDKPLNLYHDVYNPHKSFIVENSTNKSSKNKIITLPNKYEFLANIDTIKTHYLCNYINHQIEQKSYYNIMKALETKI